MKGFQIKGRLTDRNSIFLRCRDELSDSRKFALEVEKAAQRNGVKFHYNSTVSRIISDKEKILGIQLSSGEKVSVDVLVLCCAHETPNFGKIVSDLHITPMRGMTLDLYGVTNGQNGDISVQGNFKIFIVIKYYFFINDNIFLVAAQI